MSQSVLLGRCSRYGSRSPRWRAWSLPWRRADPADRELSSIILREQKRSSDPQFTPMRTGRSYSMAASIMTRKLSSCLRPIFTLPGLMRYLASARAQAGILLQQQVAVVMEIADDRDIDAEVAQSVDDDGNSLRRFVGVYGDAHQLRTGARQFHDLVDRCRPCPRCRCSSWIGRRSDECRRP